VLCNNSERRLCWKLFYLLKEGVLAGSHFCPLEDFNDRKAPQRNWSQETSLEEQHMWLRSTKAAVSAEVRGPRSAAALELEFYLSQAYYISVNPLSAFGLTLLFDVLFYLTFSYKIKAFCAGSSSPRS